MSQSIAGQNHVNSIIEKGTSHILYVFILASAAFVGLMSYPFTRTSAAPFFNAAYGKDNIALAMAASACLGIISVLIYNQMVKRYRLLPLSIASMGVVMLITTLFGFVMGNHPKFLSVLFYAWSDIYVLILVEQFWSISNTLFNEHMAKRYYGFFLACSAAGGVVGNQVVAKYAVNIGSDKMIFLCSACLLVFIGLLFILYFLVNRDSSIRKKFVIEKDIADASYLGGLSQIVTNRYLLLLALLVMSTQLYINSAYIAYNNYVASLSSVLDKQSALYGEVFSTIQIVSTLLALIVTPILLKYMGMKKTHYTIVCIMLVLTIVSLVFPGLGFIGIVFIGAKSFDYSTYRAAKELFYIPLTVAEKFQAKSFIDVFGYRLAKGIAAICLYMTGKYVGLNEHYFVLLGIISWFVLIYFLIKRYESGEVRSS